MKQIDTIMSQMTGAPVLKELANALRKYSTEFPEEEEKYHEAVSILRDALPADMTPTLDEFLAAEEADIISRILYAGFSGFRANVENFHHPFSLDFTRMDFFDCVKDHIIGHFPINYESSRITDAFYKALPEHLQDTYHDVTGYYIHMECAGPKLAHCAGYLLGNQLLPWVEPGYRKDWHQTMIYEHQLAKYFGIKSL